MRRAPRASRTLVNYALASAALALFFQALGGCGQTVEVGIDDALVRAGAPEGGESGGGASGSGGLNLSGTAGSAASSGAAPVGGAATCVPTKCRGTVYLCGNCMDDDGDGKIDSEDPDCLGPCDADEKNLSTGLTVGVGAPCRQDCYFDGDVGAGNDKCVWTHQCDTLSVAPDYPPSGEARCAYDPSKAPAGTSCSGLQSAQDPQCDSVCKPLVPNGCDCFGCCELPAGSNVYYFIGSVRGESGCELDSAGDPTSCPRCTPVASCLNPCDKCENCVGRGADPDPSCGASAGACPIGQSTCTSNAQCDYQEYCVTGCCVRAPEPT